MTAKGTEILQCPVCEAKAFQVHRGDATFTLICKDCGEPWGQYIVETPVRGVISLRRLPGAEDATIDAGPLCDECGMIVCVCMPDDVAIRELGQAVKLLEYALHLCQHGERAPGGNETWAQWGRDTETFLRARLPAEGDDGA